MKTNHTDFAISADLDQSSHQCIENNRLVPWIEKVYLARRSNLSGEPKANPINYAAEPDKLSQSTAPTYYSIYPVAFICYFYGSFKNM